MPDEGGVCGKHNVTLGRNALYISLELQLSPGSNQHLKDIRSSDFFTFGRPKAANARI
jgi:hypothetical protein